ncbi:reverse transcriptase domain-containing protein [Tanacetum coccineum]
MADNRTMEQLIQAPTEGYEDAIVIPKINANFELKHGLINLVQNKQFFGHDKEDPHAYIRYFNKITSTMRFPEVPSTSIKLMLFPFSLEGSARIWLEKEPPRSILTWDNLVSKFNNQFFSPSKTTNLRTLPSQTVTNPREHINAITTRSGKTCEGPSASLLVPDTVVSYSSKGTPKQNPSTSMDKAKKTVQEPNSPEPNSYQPKLPYPKRMKVREKDTPSAQQSRFMKLFKQLRLEIGFKDALSEMPNFQQWFKHFTDKQRETLEKIAITTVNAECSAIILNKVPEKLEDPEKFLIPCALQELDRTNALADSGASIKYNLLILSTKNLG